MPNTKIQMSNQIFTVLDRRLIIQRFCPNTGLLLEKYHFFVSLSNRARMTKFQNVCPYPAVARI